MKYGDFSSVVQLGVGLHVGTALLQLYGELGVQPLVRVLNRTRSLFLAPVPERAPKELEEELARIESQYEIFKIQLFQEYQKFVRINSIVAIILAFILVAIAYKAQDDVAVGYEWQTIVMFALSLLPAPVTLGVLWVDANRQVKPMRDKADDLEKRALASLYRSTR
jgi:di/tricarboxylate transporter